MLNAISVDLEEWFCVKNFSETIKYEEWDSLESRIEKSVDRLLTLFSKYNTKATFFVLGWIADRNPELIKKIAEKGHEIASHGYSHSIVKDLTPEKFEEDIKESIRAIKDAVDTNILGFRAPSFSVDLNKTWIFDILNKYGFKYDSSIFPVALHPDYANSKSPLNIHKIDNNLIEVPMSCFKFAGLTLPCSGGGYFRLLPYWYTSFGIKMCNHQNRPAIFYLHPWEIDPDQERVNNISLSKRIRHYTNLSKTFIRLEQLLNDFKFTTISDIIKNSKN